MGRFKLILGRACWVRLTALGDGESKVSVGFSENLAKEDLKKKKTNKLCNRSQIVLLATDAL